MAMAIRDPRSRSVYGASIWWRGNPRRRRRHPSLRCDAAAVASGEPRQNGLEASALRDRIYGLRADLDLAHDDQAAVVDADGAREPSRLSVVRVVHRIHAIG